MQWKSSFLTVVIAISLMLTLNIVKSWQPLDRESWNLNPWLKNHAFFTFITFRRINSFNLYQFYCNTTLIISNLQKNCHQVNLWFVCLQFYKHNYLNIVVLNICFYINVKESKEMTAKDLRSISSSGTFKSRKLVWTLSKYVLILVFIYLWL